MSLSDLGGPKSYIRLIEDLGLVIGVFSDIGKNKTRPLENTYDFLNMVGESF